MKFVKRFWDKWDQKWGFGKFLGGFLERKPVFWASHEKGVRWASLSLVVASECWTALAVLHVLTFRGVLGHPYVFLMYCFDVVLMNWVYVIMFAWNWLSFFELRRTLNIHEHEFGMESKWGFFSNEMLMLWFNYCGYECRRNM